MKSLIIVVVFCFAFLPDSSAQDLIAREDRLVQLLDDLRAAQNDQEKSRANKAFKAYLEETIQLAGAFDYPFDRLSTLGSIKSPDNKVRLFNWNIEQDDETQTYYCYILHFNDRKREYQMSELVDNSLMIPARPTEVLAADEWYGALYYKIIPIDKGSKTAYTLLGWDGNNSMSTIKLMDVLYFSGTSPKLGSPVFKQKDETLKRVFFEHSKKCVMHLNYEEDRKRIIMDHLSPEAPTMKGMYSFYVPDLSYDAYVLRNNKWYLKEDVIGVNKAASQKIAIETYDSKTGETRTKEVKNKWLDPSDPDAPAGGAQHVATTPDQEDKVNEPSPKSQKLSRKERKNQPKSYNPVGSKKRRN